MATAKQMGFSDRTRFNWGFWDGIGGAWRGRSTVGHFDRAYVAGVQAGEDAASAGERPSSSDAAWQAAQR